MQQIDENELKALIYLLDDDDKEIAYHIEQKLLSIGLQVVPMLENQWEQSNNTWVQERIEKIIRQIQYNAFFERIGEWVQDDKRDLLYGMWLVATYLYPNITYKEIQIEIEQIYYEVWLEFKVDLHPLDQIKILNNFFYHKLKFKVSNDFYSPQNLMINYVLDTKKGNMLSLCILYLLIANKLKLPMHGMILPYLVILTYKTNYMQIFVNAHNKGIVFSKKDMELYLNSVVGQGNTAYLNQYATNTDLIKEVVNNLLICFQNNGETAKADDMRRVLKIFDK